MYLIVGAKVVSQYNSLSMHGFILLCLRKASIHEHCRKVRLSLVEMINNNSKLLKNLL
jgi:hypothetical protein